MRLAELVAEAGGHRIVGDAGVEVLDLAYDSRKAQLGTLFFCVPGEKFDGHEFGAAAVEAGAVALVVERELDLDATQVVVPDARLAMASLAARFWEDPTRKLRVVGVTGTNGKTTTVFLIRQILEAAEIQCGLLGTVRQIVGGSDEGVERTTPEAIDLQATFRRMLEAGDEACVMEVSSHAVELHRCDAIHFEAAVFTNLTQDHLDFHGSMEDYFHSKRKLFTMKPRTSIVNLDDPYGRELAREFSCVTFSVEGKGASAAGREADYVARDVAFDSSGSSFSVNASSASLKRAAEGPLLDRVEHVRTPLPGDFNVANALAALVTARALNVDLRAAAVALAEAKPAPGRFEPVDAGQAFAVVVDYAHTPDSLENVLRAARRLTAGRVIAVFGAGGDRDRAKRPKMGRAAAELADLAIVTSDNPRSEDPDAIVAEILTGVEDGAEVEAEPDRRAAIALAFRRARPGDLVVIAGKGHEQGQEFEEGRKVPFDDREVARTELRRLSREEHPPAAGST